MRSRHFLSGLTALASILLLAVGPGLGSDPQARRDPARVLRQRDRQPRLPHRARLRNDVGGDERRLRPRQHHPRRQVRGRRRRVVAGLPRRPPLHLQAPEERPLPRRHARRRRRRQVQHRSADGPGHQVGHAGLSTRPCTASRCSIRLTCRSASSSRTPSCCTCSPAYRTGLVLYSPTATQKYTLQDRQAGQARRRRGVRSLQADRMGEGQPPRHGPLRQVLPAGPAATSTA